MARSDRGAGVRARAGRIAGLRAGAAALAFAVAGAGAAGAQTLDEPDEGATLDTLVVTASGAPIDLRDAPASITVVTQEELRNTAAPDVRGVLSKIEGVTLGRGGNMNTVQIRGLSERYTLFLIDGKRVNSDPNLFRGNDYDSGWVPIDAIERIEVVRGPMSSLYGSDAMGGVVNIITKKDNDVLTGSLTGEYTYQENRKAGDNWSTSLYLAGPIADKVGFRLSGSWAHRDADDWSINPNPDLAGFTESTEKFIDGTLYWRPNAENEVEVNAGWSDRDHDGFPLKRYEVGVTHYGYYGFGTTETRIWADRIRNEYGHGNRLGEKQPNTAWNNGFDGKAVLPLEWGAPQNLTLGLSYLYQKIEDTYVLTGPGGSEASVWQGAVYAEDEIRFTDDFLLTLGLRADDNEVYGGHLSPRVYGVYHFTDALTLKGGWSTGFKSPTLLEMTPAWMQISCGGSCYLVGNDDLDPEDSDSFELGLRYDSGPIRANVTAFRNDIDDMIQFPPARTGDPAVAPTYDNFVGFTADGIPMFAYQNIESARTQGVEVAASYDLNDRWTIGANYTYLDAKNTTDGIDAPLAYQPKHSANLAIDWRATEKLNLNLTVSYSGTQYTYVPTNGDMQYAHKVGAFTTADILASYVFNDRVTARLGVLNLADEEVARDVSDDFNVEGRRYFAALTGRF